jgi:hypothetical protein
MSLAFRLGTVYLDTPNITCPICGDDYSHVREAGTLLGGDEGHIYPGTQLLGLSSERRSALSVVIDGECGHSWELRIQQHKGLSLLQIRRVPAPAAVDETDGGT